MNTVYAGCNVYGRHAKGDTRLKDRKAWTVVEGMREPLGKRETFEAIPVLIGLSTCLPLKALPGAARFTFDPSLHGVHHCLRYRWKQQNELY